MCDFNAPLFTFYHKKARTLFLVKKKKDKIFCFDYLNDNSIQLSQVLNLKDNYIYHIRSLYLYPFRSNIYNGENKKRKLITGESKKEN